MTYGLIPIYNNYLAGNDNMIYVCAKCKFLFERKNEPSKCPSCESQCVMGASEDERQTYMDLHGRQGGTGNSLMQSPQNYDDT
jgi:DNA-directed RNA polymerase subunit RPC12/RpoP